MAAINVRTFADLPNNINISDIEVYCNGKYKMSGADFVSRLIKGLGIRKIVQPSQVYTGTSTVVLTIDAYVGEDLEVLRNGVETNYTYTVGGGGKIASIMFSIPLDGDEVKIVKREIYQK
jgi:hypothetical protein